MNRKEYIDKFWKVESVGNDLFYVVDTRQPDVEAVFEDPAAAELFIQTEREK